MNRMHGALGRAAESWWPLRGRLRSRLFELGRGGCVRSLAFHRLVDEDGKWLNPDFVFGRGDALHLLRGASLYRVTVEMAADG